MAKVKIEELKIDDSYGYTHNIVLVYDDTDSTQSVYGGKGYSIYDATTSIGIVYRNGQYYENSWSSRIVSGKKLIDKIRYALSL